MGGEQHRHAAVAREALQQLEDLRLHSDIERGGRLIRDHQLRFRQQRHGDHQPLPLAAGDLVRILAQDALGVRQLHQAQQFQHAGAVGAAAFPRRHAPGPQQRRLEAHQVVDLRANGEDRVEGGEGVLRDVGDLPPADLGGEFRLPEPEQRPALEADLPRLDPRRVARQDAEDGARERRLAAARFPDEAHDLAAPDRQVHAIQHARDSGVGCEGDAQPPDGDQFTFHAAPPAAAAGRARRAARPPAG